jgi:cytochrome c biogenesis factor
VTFLGTDIRNEPHRVATVARVAITKDGKPVEVVEPRMNQYAAMREPIGTPAVHSTLAGDLYVSIMNLDGSGQNVGLLLLITPMVSWIWIAVLLMGLGGIISIIPHRQSSFAAASASEPSPATVAETPA